MNEQSLQLTGISKRFPEVKAPSAVHLELRSDEVHALVGENGAGKSTLMKILAGIHQMALDGEDLPETIDTGRFWYDVTNIDDTEIQAVLYE